MKRMAKAFWQGDLKAGHGSLTTQSRVLDQTQYSFNTRFADGTGTNPEELLAAAHAGCFTMAIAHALSQKSYSPGELNTTTAVTLDMSTGSISLIELELSATLIEGLSPEDFQEIALQAKNNCLISKALAGVKIELTVQYQQ
ncbi:OsmC family peroxiredoxin [Mucilaginibacter pocheonensis]|uniref:Osmotically inducible protein OsmC n=1 Tax=Mucilaginibacter pocheonensis TaxID=398050 RepID=A0ABU1TF90_9SPHI|nr:OsmC family peroxiredoxin [Mucilaginibacter pocheonensis]MDR6943909.1 osmotically inducible protein OsmC [Mucilaginibacter pocheonensis]